MRGRPINKKRLPALRNKFTGLLGVSAECDCGWTLESRNATGVAAQHAMRTGHTVRVEQTIGITFNRQTS
jgi:hypothetical protein